MRRRVGGWLRALEERIVGPYTGMDAVTDHLLDGVEAAQAVACKVLGHEVFADHCGNPDHDYCVWCQERVPGGALR